MAFEDDLKLLFVGEDSDRYPMLFLPKQSNKKQNRPQTTMALDVLYQLYLYWANFKYIDFNSENDYVHPL